MPMTQLSRLVSGRMRRVSFDCKQGANLSCEILDIQRLTTCAVGEVGNAK